MKYQPTPLLVLLFFCLNLSLNAQSYIGLSGGGGLTPEVFFRAAIPVEVPVHQNVSLRSELVYIQRANRDILLKLIGDRDYWQATISYVEIPVLAQMHLDIKTFSIYALIGPKFGFGVRIAANYSEGNVLYEERLSFNEKGIRRFDVGVNLGAGLEKRIVKDRKIFMEYRYYLGLSDINTDSSNTIYNQGQVFNLGFLLPIFGGE